MSLGTEKQVQNDQYRRGRLQAAAIQYHGVVSGKLLTSTQVIAYAK